MKIIVYKIRSNSYECINIKDDGGTEISIVFDEPISGTLTVKDKILPIVRGVCKTAVSELSEGECAPTLFSGGKRMRLESFYIKDGFVLRRAPDEEYVRELYENYSLLEKRVLKIESELENINERINQKINF